MSLSKMVVGSVCNICRTNDIDFDSARDSKPICVTCGVDDIKPDSAVDSKLYRIVDGKYKLVSGLCYMNVFIDAMDGASEFMVDAMINLIGFYPRFSVVDELYRSIVGGPIPAPTVVGHTMLHYGDFIRGDLLDETIFGQKLDDMFVGADGVDVMDTDALAAMIAAVDDSLPDGENGGAFIALLVLYIEEFNSLNTELDLSLNYEDMMEFTGLPVPRIGNIFSFIGEVIGKTGVDVNLVRVPALEPTMAGCLYTCGAPPVLYTAVQPMFCFVFSKCYIGLLGAGYSHLEGACYTAIFGTDGDYDGAFERHYAFYKLGRYPTFSVLCELYVEVYNAPIPAPTRCSTVLLHYTNDVNVGMFEIDDNYVYDGNMMVGGTVLPGAPLEGILERYDIINTLFREIEGGFDLPIENVIEDFICEYSDASMTVSSLLHFIVDRLDDINIELPLPSTIGDTLFFAKSSIKMYFHCWFTLMINYRGYLLRSVLVEEFRGVPGYCYISTFGVDQRSDALLYLGIYPSMGDYMDYMTSLGNEIMPPLNLIPGMYHYSRGYNDEGDEDLKIIPICDVNRSWRVGGDSEPVPFRTGNLVSALGAPLVEDFTKGLINGIRKGDVATHLHQMLGAKLLSEVEQRQATRIPISLPPVYDPAARAMLSGAYPDYEITHRGGNTVPHEIRNAARVLEMDIMLRNIRYTKFVGDNFGAVNIVDYGGNFMNHLGAGRFDIHSCCPILDHRDGLRFSDRLGKFFMMDNINNRQMEFLRWCAKDKENMRTLYCNEKAQDCKVKAPIMIACHSTYDSTLNDIAEAMEAHESDCLFGVVLFNYRMFMEKKGSTEHLTWDTEVVRGRRKIVIGFAGDHSLIYQHDYLRYKQFFESMWTRSRAGNLFIMECGMERMGSLFFRVQRVHVRPNVTTELLKYIPTDMGKMVEVAYYTVDADGVKRGVFRLRKQNILVDVELCCKTLNHALRVRENKFNVNEVLNFMLGQVGRIVVNGNTIKQGNKVLREDVDGTAIYVASAIYIVAYEMKYHNGLVMKKLVDTIKKFREDVIEGTLWSKLKYALFGRFADKSVGEMMGDMVLANCLNLTFQMKYQTDLKKVPEQVLVKQVIGKYVNCREKDDIYRYVSSKMVNVKRREIPEEIMITSEFFNALHTGKLEHSGTDITHGDTLSVLSSNGSVMHEVDNSELEINLDNFILQKAVGDGSCCYHAIFLAMGMKVTGDEAREILKRDMDIFVKLPENEKIYKLNYEYFRGAFEVLEQDEQGTFDVLMVASLVYNYNIWVYDKIKDKTYSTGTMFGDENVPGRRIYLVYIGDGDQGHYDALLPKKNLVGGGKFGSSFEGSATVDNAFGEKVVCTDTCMFGDVMVGQNDMMGENVSFERGRRNAEEERIHGIYNELHEEFNALIQRGTGVVGVSNVVNVFSELYRKINTGTKVKVGLTAAICTSNMVVDKYSGRPVSFNPYVNMNATLGYVREHMYEILLGLAGAFVTAQMARISYNKVCGVYRDDLHVMRRHMTICHAKFMGMVYDATCGYMGTENDTYVPQYEHMYKLFCSRIDYLEGNVKNREVYLKTLPHVTAPKTLFVPGETNKARDGKVTTNDGGAVTWGNKYGERESYKKVKPNKSGEKGIKRSPFINLDSFETMSMTSTVTTGSNTEEVFTNYETVREKIAKIPRAEYIALTNKKRRFDGDKYMNRSAAKLDEMLNIYAANNSIVVALDLCAAPGGCTKLMAERSMSVCYTTYTEGNIEMKYKSSGAACINAGTNGNLTNQDVVNEIINSNTKLHLAVDFCMADGCINSDNVDRESENEKLLSGQVDLVLDMVKPGGMAFIKIFGVQNKVTQTLIAELMCHFAEVKFHASKYRSAVSTELYVVCINKLKFKNKLDKRKFKRLLLAMVKYNCSHLAGCLVNKSGDIGGQDRVKTEYEDTVQNRCEGWLNDNYQMKQAVDVGSGEIGDGVETNVKNGTTTGVGETNEGHVYVERSYRRRSVLLDVETTEREHDELTMCDVDQYGNVVVVAVDDDVEKDEAYRGVENIVNKCQITKLGYGITYINNEYDSEIPRIVNIIVVKIHNITGGIDVLQTLTRLGEIANDMGATANKKIVIHLGSAILRMFTNDFTEYIKLRENANYKNAIHLIFHVERMGETGATQLSYFNQSENKPLDGSEQKLHRDKGVQISEQMGRLSTTGDRHGHAMCALDEFRRMQRCVIGILDNNYRVNYKTLLRLAATNTMSDYYSFERIGKADDMLNVYDRHTRKFWYKENRKFECCFAGDRFYTLSNGVVGSNNFDSVPVEYRYVLVGDSCVLMQAPKMYKKFVEVRTNTIVMPDVILVNGVPGCGKTKEIVENHKIAAISGRNDATLVLTTTRDNKDEIIERSKKRFEKMRDDGKVDKSKKFTTEQYRTIDSVCIRGFVNKDVTYNEIWIDECFMSHVGQIVYIALLVKAKKIYCFGDPNQIPFINRVSGFLSVYSSILPLVVKETYRCVSYRVPADVAYYYSEKKNDKGKKIYPGGFYTTNSNMKTVSTIPLGSRDEPQLYDRNNRIAVLTFKQSEKDKVAKIDTRIMVRTINEFQGRQSKQTVCIRYSNFEKEELFTRDEQLLVALTRHTNTMCYVTPICDKLAKVIEEINKFEEYKIKSIIIRATDVDKLNTTVKQKLRGGGYVLCEDDENINDDLMLVSSYVPTVEHKYEELILRAGMYDTGRYAYEKPYDVTSVLDYYSGVGYDKYKLGHVVPRVEELQSFYDSLFLDSGYVDTSQDQEKAVNGDLVLYMESIKIDVTRLYFNKQSYDFMRPQLRTTCPHRRINCPVETIFGAQKRNGAVPKLMGIVDIEETVQNMIERFKEQCLRSNMLYMLHKYKDEPINVMSDDIEEWKRKQDKTFEIQEMDINLWETGKLQEYSYMMKSKPKPDANPDALYKYAAVQTIAYKTKEENAIFCGIMNEIKRRLICMLRGNIVIYQDMTVGELELVINKRMPRKAKKTLRSLEIDISMYDKSQGVIALKFECEIMRMFGVPEFLVETWYKMHETADLRTLNEGVTISVTYQRKSGDAMTFLGNTLFLLGVLSTQFELKDMALVLAAGDDSLLLSEEDFEDRIYELSNTYNLEAKMFTYDSLYFCSKFIIIKEDVVRVVPDFAKVLIKLGRKDLVNAKHVEDYRISLRDLLKCYNNHDTLTYLQEAMAERYLFSDESRSVPDMFSVMAHLLSFLESTDAFASLFYRNPGDIEFQNDVLPSLDI